MPDISLNTPFRVCVFPNRLSLRTEEYQNALITKGIWELVFRPLNGTIHLPITSFTVDRHFVDYAQHESMQRVGRLINLCNDQHDCLDGQRSILPKRVVDVGDDSTHTLRLYCPAEDKKARYTILSHCWGGTSPFLTLQSNIEALKQGFDIAELPTTFRDAVVFTRALGIRYLWIDSICIIQEDK
jgi:hypothetical protein